MTSFRRLLLTVLGDISSSSLLLIEGAGGVFGRRTLVLGCCGAQQTLPLPSSSCLLPPLLVRLVHKVGSDEGDGVVGLDVLVGDVGNGCPVLS